jgi:hypothetical protein
VWNVQVHEWPHRFLASLEGGSIYFIKRNVFVRLKKSLRLGKTSGIQARVDATALHNVLKIEIRLSMTNQVYFFAAQFCVIFGRAFAGPPVKNQAQY